MHFIGNAYTCDEILYASSAQQIMHWPAILYFVFNNCLNPLISLMPYCFPDFASIKYKLPSLNIMKSISF
jgi:hypothetical protein